MEKCLSLGLFHRELRGWQSLKEDFHWEEENGSATGQPFVTSLVRIVLPTPKTNFTCSIA